MTSTYTSPASSTTDTKPVLSSSDLQQQHVTGTPDQSIASQAIGVGSNNNNNNNNNDSGLSPSSASLASATTPGACKQCAGCSGKISDRFLLHAMDRYWHTGCLKCSCCQVHLGEIGTSCFTKAGMILCKNDYVR
jgi:hypothetical protein